MQVLGEYPRWNLRAAFHSISVQTSNSQLIGFLLFSSPAPSCLVSSAGVTGGCHCARHLFKVLKKRLQSLLIDHPTPTPRVAYSMSVLWSVLGAWEGIAALILSFGGLFDSLPVDQSPRSQGRIPWQCPGNVVASGLHGDSWWAGPPVTEHSS